MEGVVPWVSFPEGSETHAERPEEGASPEGGTVREQEGWATPRWAISPLVYGPSVDRAEGGGRCRRHQDP